MNNDIHEKVNKIFVENYAEIDKDFIRKEIEAMRNAQPPSYPTFMVGQEEVKDTLKQQLSRCFSNRSFFHTVIVGEVGGGKTHLLNLIKSRFSDEDAYIIQFRAEETEVASYSFPKMVVARLFNRYYDEFKQIFLNIDLSKFYNQYDEDEIANKIASELQVDINLASAIYHYAKQGDKKSSAIRIIGGCENVKDISKLKINKLVDRDYMEIIELFLKYDHSKKHLLVMLDEFEHSYTLFTPAKRRDFLKGYKSFLDRFAQSRDCPFLLITAATVQYNGQLKDSLSKIDTALASRLEPQTIMLNDFDIASNEAFKNLYLEIAKRFKDAYGYDVGCDGYLKMRKKIFDLWGSASAQKKTYREVISSMISLMDKMQREKETFATDMHPKSEKYEKYDMVETRKTTEGYDLLKREIELKWNDSNGKTRLTMIKKGIESLLALHITDFNAIKFGSGRGGSSVISFPEQEGIALIYIALQNLKDKLAACKKLKEETEQGESKGRVEACFVYLPGEGIEDQIKFYPDIVACNIERERLDLIILGSKSDLSGEVKETIKNNLQNLFAKIKAKG